MGTAKPEQQGKEPIEPEETKKAKEAAEVDEDGQGSGESEQRPPSDS